MKKETLLLLFALLTQILYGQKKDSCYAGVYLAQQDFLNNRMSYKIDKNVKGNKVDFLLPADLTMTLKLETKDSVIKFKPGEIYGYYDCGKLYRYSPGTELNAHQDYYKVLEAKGLVIYSSLLVSGSEIFYSQDLVSPIHRLTLKNLENDFSASPEFLEAARKLSKKGKDGLASLENGAFQINRLYGKTPDKTQSTNR